MSSGDIQQRSRAGALTLAVTSVLAMAQQARAADAPKPTEESVIDVVIVTAQRREENLIDVPIAVAAFSGEALERRQIDQATDLQFNVPNVSYTKTNFTGSNFQIRGIGVSSVAASGDSGVEQHFNSMPVKNPRLYETEFFDVQSVEVLRRLERVPQISGPRHDKLIGAMPLAHQTCNLVQLSAPAVGGGERTGERFPVKG